MTLGENIRKRRKEKGVTLRVLSKLLGVSHNTVCRWERDQMSPSIYAMWDLADYFGCTIDELCGRKDGANNG